MSKPFMTAEWLDLCLISYLVPESALAPHLPPGLELDRRDGQTHVSLVGFNFKNTRVFGAKWPGYVNFSELNLRFYARRGNDRGVVFLREFVPQRLVASLARWTYYERYVTAPLRHETTVTGGKVTATCSLAYGGGKHSFSVVARKAPYLPIRGSVEHFFKEQRFGYNVDRKGRTIRYEVRHPEWQVYPVDAYAIDLDWEKAYGPEWQFLTKQQPSSVVFALGSEVTVYPHDRI